MGAIVLSLSGRQKPSYGTGWHTHLGNVSVKSRRLVHCADSAI